MRGEKIIGWLYLRRRMLYFGGFLLGTSIHSITPLTKYSPNVWTVLSLIFFLTFLVTKHRYRFISIAIAMLILGLLRFDLSVPASLPSNFESTPAVIQNIWQSRYGKKANISIDGAKVQINLKDNIPIGSKIKLTCKLKPRLKEEGQSNYQFYMWQYYAMGYCGNAKIQMVADPPWYDLRHAFYTWREQANRRIMGVIPGDEGILIAGLLYGERNLSPAAKELFRRAGLTHIIAVSGSNFTIIVTVVFSILLGLGLWRHQAFTITTAAMLLFFGFVGFSASVARAAIMGWVLLLSRQLGRSPNIWHLCLLSAFLLALIDPWMPAYDAGFALSFLATMGLVTWTPIFTKLFHPLPAAAGLREAAATTGAATLMTMPYIAFVFGRVSLAGLFTNLIAVPLVPWAMLFGAISAGFGAFHHTINLPGLGLSKLIFISARIADVFPWMDIHINGMNVIILIGTYALIIRLWFLLSEKNDLYTKQSIFCNPHT
ncbi:hypothetical protein GF391_00565 [Candidatus Uhrbacteria bacterium]|nr:hypothetical protein [Candidatus Uhrbacteria bacterium]